MNYELKYGIILPAEVIHNNSNDDAWAMWRCLAKSSSKVHYKTCLNRGIIFAEVGKKSAPAVLTVNKS